jgi:Holliday junction resolvase
MGKGHDAERAFCRTMYDAGWMAARIAASGSGTERELPDVVLGDRNRTYAVEVKRTSSGRVYLPEDEIESLRTVARGLKMQVRIAVKFDLEPSDPAWGADRPGFYMIDPADMRQTNSGTYAITKADVAEVGIPEVQF